ncbi:Aste57867_24820 [Aphanomyces stellatus]|uniref:Aste57867_24820 protein n=1 Tax=Aphanomyces stellatus TaxID=120398 RepID=A0A485LRG1_9STRA|nr:hypothetical protein As57867_024742 [Aphanomyces stellatus]VFU01455.1 Aste57867_24820 [Aphanomyces stellatus]
MGLTPNVETPATVVNVVVEEPTIVDNDELGRKLKPKEVVEQLDKYIIGQKDAKKAVAVALRNRWRRQQLPAELRPEVSPKNILMIGPTGCGKTEIARRLAKLSQAPFVKVEATKFTEVGFHGRDVDQIIKDLVENAIQLVKKHRMERVRKDIAGVVEQRIIDALAGQHTGAQSRQTFLHLLRSGELDERMITIDVRTSSNPSATISVMDSAKFGQNMSEVVKAISGKKTEKKQMTVADARPILEEMELENAIDMGDVVKEAISEAEENGIVFIDEIDKICSNGSYRGADASDEGVQRDLLPLIEGSTISTKHGNVNTDHILFIGSGAFHAVKPSNLLAELQGRLPIRVELKALTENDLWRILTEPVANLIMQQKALLATEKVKLHFEEDAIKEIARVAYEINHTVENIGARRLHTVLEKVVEDISFEASDFPEDHTLHVTKDMVADRIGAMLKKSDLSKFILINIPNENDGPHEDAPILKDSMPSGETSRGSGGDVAVKAHEYRLDLHAVRPKNPVLSQTYGRHLLLQKACQAQFPVTARPSVGRRSQDNNNASKSAREVSPTRRKGLFLEDILEKRRRLKAEEEDDVTHLQVDVRTPAVDEIQEMLARLPDHSVKRRIVSTPMAAAAVDSEDILPRRDANDKSVESVVTWLKKQEFITHKCRNLERDKASFLALTSLQMRALSVDLCRAIDTLDDARDLEARLLAQKRHQLQRTMRETTACIAQLKARREHHQPVLVSEVDECRDHIDTTEAAIAAYRSRTEERQAALLIDAKKTEHDLAQCDAKMAVWENRNPIERPTHRSLMRRSNTLVDRPMATSGLPRSAAAMDAQHDATRVRALDELLRETGGGWEMADHAIFVAALQLSTTSPAKQALSTRDGDAVPQADEAPPPLLDALQVEALVQRCRAKLPTKSEDAVRTHLEWYTNHVALVEEKRRTIARWKQRRLERQEADTTAAVVAEVSSRETDMRRLREQKEAKARVRAWKEEKRLQLIYAQAGGNGGGNATDRRPSLDTLKQLEMKQKVALYKLQKEEERAQQTAMAELLQNAELSRPPSKAQLQHSSSRALATAKQKFDKVCALQQAQQQMLPARPKLPFVPKDTNVRQPTKASAARIKTPEQVADVAAARRAAGAHEGYVSGGPGAAHVKGQGFGYVASQPRAIPAWRKR